jgi:hypothetical protein
MQPVLKESVQIVIQGRHLPFAQVISGHRMGRRTLAFTEPKAAIFTKQPDDLIEVPKHPAGSRKRTVWLGKSPLGHPSPDRHRVDSKQARHRIDIVIPVPGRAHYHLPFMLRLRPSV